MDRHIARVVATIGLAGAVAGCVTLPDAAYKLYPGPTRAPTELAVVRLGNVGMAEFDDRPVARADWSEVALDPGEHTIRWRQEFGVSVLVDARGAATGATESRATLLAGHTYTLHAERTYGTGYRMYFWIVDDVDGRVIAGEPKP
jgi:hypothetical protein